MNYYVFRINYEEKYFPKLQEELKAGILRQGWGAEGMTIEHNDRQKFIDAWRNKWGIDDADEKYMIGKWNTLNIINEMKEGDLIIIPKVHIKDVEKKEGYFTIARRTAEPYRFEPKNGDFGHIVPVEPLLSFSHNYNDDSRIVSAKLKSYRYPINRVYVKEFHNAIDLLLEEKDKNSLDCDMTSIEALTKAVEDAKNVLFNKILEQIQMWSSSQLERTIEELFVINGYTLKNRNTFNGEGGDIDLTFNCFADNSFMSDISSFSDRNNIPEIRIQAKNKKDDDDNDIEGVNQLINMEGQANAINIVINTTKDFSKETKKKAAEYNIILIDGTQFASLLVKYGLNFIE